MIQNRVIDDCSFIQGLEFPVVFISGLDDGLFPLHISIDNKKELEEERRLYVALTRAQQEFFYYTQLTGVEWEVRM